MLIIEFKVLKFQIPNFYFKSFIQNLTYLESYKTLSKGSGKKTDLK